MTDSKIKRSIGRVNWYGGDNSKTGRENKFGFIDCVGGDSIFVHKSGLICSPSKMVEGRWVSYAVVSGSKGPAAERVVLAEEDSDLSVVEQLLENPKVPVETRLKSGFHVPLVESHPLIEKLEKTVREYDREYLRGVIEFPAPWKELDRGSPLYTVLPVDMRREWFDKQYPEIGKALAVLSSAVEGVERSTDVYKTISPRDTQLALSWATSDRDYEKAKMLSARGAELVAAEFFREKGFKVDDVAIHQLTKESEDWITHDLIIDSQHPLDVKNARSSINSSTFVEYTIKRFKTDSSGKNVTIIGVLSPYLKLEELGRHSVWHRDRIKILGGATGIQVREFEKEFSKRELTVDFGDSQRWPIWIFNNDLDWFSIQKDSIDAFSVCAESVKEDEWNDCQQNVLPALIAAGLDIPADVREGLLPWQNWYVDKVLQKSQSGGLTLPWIYLFTFHHFLEATTNIESSEARKFSPDGYAEILFFSGSDSDRPLCLIDPLRVMKMLIRTLGTLWDHRHTANLVSLRNYTFRGEGLLRGTDPQGMKVTVLAYCGGFIDGKGKCGHSPLVIGKHETCRSCQMLICDKCGHCSQRCQEESGTRSAYNF